MKRYLVVRAGSGYEQLTLFEGEEYEEAVDKVDGSSVVVVKRDGRTVNTAGELCAELHDVREARLMVSRLNAVAGVMDS